MVRGLQNGLGRRLGVIPQETPVNPKKTKIGALQNGCPKLISRPRTPSSYKLVSLKMVCLDPCLTCTCPTFPRKPHNLFAQSPKLRQQKARFLQNGMVDQKNVLTKCLLFLEKCPWNGTWVKPFHSGNVHRDRFLAKLETTVQRNSQMISP